MSKPKPSINPPISVESYNPINGDKPELSIIMPGVRPYRWPEIYTHICKSTEKRTFELIIVSPFVPTHSVASKPNVKFVKDLGSPVRAANIGATLAEGKLITWGCNDDGLFMPNGLDAALDNFYSLKPNKKNVLVWKYIEGGQNYKDEYYKFNFHRGPAGEGIGSDYIPDDYFIFNTPIMYREFFEEVGGFDIAFEGTAMANNDFAIRAQKLGAHVSLLEGMAIFVAAQAPDTSGDHGPVHIAQTTKDEPLYEKKYKINCNWEDNQMHLELTNEWKKAPLMWPTKWARAVEECDSVYGPIYSEEIEQDMRELQMRIHHENRGQQGVKN